MKHVEARLVLKELIFFKNSTKQGGERNLLSSFYSLPRKFACNASLLWRDVGLCICRGYHLWSSVSKISLYPKNRVKVGQNSRQWLLFSSIIAVLPIHNFFQREKQPININTRALCSIRERKTTIGFCITIMHHLPHCFVLCP